MWDLVKMFCHCGIPVVTDVIYVTVQAVPQGITSFPNVMDVALKAGDKVHNPLAIAV